jgi:CheY-like chemotaxis protein
VENEATATTDEQEQSDVADLPPKLLLVRGSNVQQLGLAERLAGVAEVVTVASPVRALTMLASGDFAGVVADSEYFSESLDLGRLLQNERVLRAMPEGVLLLDAANVIRWGNGRLAEWTGKPELVGLNFYDVLSEPEWLSLDGCPLERSLTSGQPTAGTLKCGDNRFVRLYTVPIVEGEEAPHHLIVTLRDVTEEVLQQQKLEAIHKAGIELADILPDEVAEMDVDERIELLKDNIRQCTQDVLQFDVVEIRTLDKDTGELRPLLAEGMQPEAERRVLYADVEGNGVTGYVAATGKSYLCEDTSKDSLYLSGARDARSSLTVPLMLHEECIGTFNVESPESQRFTRSDLQFLEIFSREIAAALNTLDLLAAEKVTSAAASVEQIHRAVALPVDEILNDAVSVIETFRTDQPEVAERLHRVLSNARDIKKVIQEVGRKMAPTEARPAAARVEERPTLVGRRVLVVDAEEGIRSDAHDLLEKYQCTVETSHDGNEAIFMVRNLTEGQRYDTIIADIRLPDMSGYDLMMRLRSIVQPVPMVLTTNFGYDAEHTIVKARREGLKFVLLKPWRPEQLLETVERMIDPGTQA